MRQMRLSRSTLNTLTFGLGDSEMASCALWVLSSTLTSAHLMPVAPRRDKQCPLWQGRVQHTPGLEGPPEQFV